MTSRGREALALAATGAAIALAAMPRRYRVPGTIAAALNGAVSGYRRTYDLQRGAGLAAFVLDSSWAILGTSSGVALLGAQRVVGARYRADLSVRRNRHIYETGIRGHPDFATTVGQVVTNAAGRSGLTERRIRLVERHEELHIWQQRALGPLFPVGYGAWMLVAGGAAVVIWAVRRGDLVRTVTTLAYYDNPLEYWAYRRDDHWPPVKADPALAWRPRPV